MNNSDTDPVFDIRDQQCLFDLKSRYTYAVSQVLYQKAYDCFSNVRM